ncbi:hypothetical protein PGLA_07185 [Paenibacillus glacialis]|uniref:Uncharacterized protein n=1 Tax=Paenibacillus glacialis TaxID=494026 RepID=A0A168MA94_9BACL|nr:hypothetical protein PGLA_07185 [Paenibacillus glacialis]
MESLNYSSQNKSFKVIDNALHIATHKLKLGLYLPSSINPMVCLDTPTRWASSSCDKSFVTLASFNLIFFKPNHLPNSIF